MLLQPNSPETYALALSIENAALQGANSDAAKIADSMLDNYADSVLASLSTDNQIFAKEISFIDTLSNTQLWTLISYGVQSMLQQSNNNLTFTMASVIETCKAMHPEVNFNRESYNLADFTNMIIQTELDTAFAFAGLEIVFSFKAQKNEPVSDATTHVNAEVE